MLLMRPNRIVSRLRWLGLSAGLALGAFAHAAPPAKPGATLSVEEHHFLEELQRASFRFFEEQTHPRTHLVSDRALAGGGAQKGKASIASSGFALAGWAIAAERGWVERTAALERVRLMLRFLADQAPRQHGFFYHFMELDSGARAWECEVSPIDTSLMFFGAIVAREYFGDPEITALVNRLGAEMDWTWFLNGGETLAMSWRDEAGFSRHRWSAYSEHLAMYLLGLGSATHPLPERSWLAWRREQPITFRGRHYLAGAPLFIHQFSQAFADFRAQRDAFADYYRNSVLATLAHRQFCIELATEFPSWSEKLWGVTASDSARGYLAWGGPPRGLDGGSLDGTLVPCAAAGSLPFAPREALLTLRHMRAAFGDRIWKHYGFVDAFNPDSGWVAPDVIGLDVGITLVQAENARTGLVWSLFMRAPEVQRGFARAGFISTQRDLPAAAAARLGELASRTWRSLAEEPSAGADAKGRLHALLAAYALGQVDPAAAADAARALLTALSLPENDIAQALTAAALVTLRQALPALAADATARLDALSWSNQELNSRELGSASRLARFFQIAARTQPPAAWSELTRTPVARGPVYVLSPATPADQLLPGLWLDEREIITGASAAQLAYAHRESAAEPLLLALLADHFPSVAADRLERSGNPLAGASLRDRAALLVALANTLVGDRVRRWFQADPLVQSARAAIPEFSEAAFGPNNSIVARRELAGPGKIPPPRTAVVRHARRPSAEWDWQTVSGPAFRDSSADVRPGDPEISLRFALAWDDSALVFQAEAVDTPAGSVRPERRREVVELYLDPRANGFASDRAEDRIFYFLSGGTAREVPRNQPFPAEIVRGEHGFTVHARIPWEKVGVRPAPGLRLGATAAVQISGPRPHLPAIKLNWRRHLREDGTTELGTLVLEP